MLLELNLIKKKYKILVFCFWKSENAFLESGVIDTVLGLSPTDISARDLSVIASISVTESLSGLTATTRVPSGDTAIDEEECD